MGVHRFGEGVVATILSLYLLLGLIGNGLTVVALFRCSRLRNVTSTFIISLSIADCVFCVLVLPWEIARLYAGEWLWDHGTICVIVPFIRYWNVAVSLLSIAMITINRYILIGHYNLYKKVYKKLPVAAMIAFCWFLPISFLIPTLSGHWGRFGFVENQQTCSIIEKEGHSPKRTLFAIAFCVPCLVIVVCYSRIYAVIRRSEQRIHEHRVANKFDDTDQNGNSRETRRRSAEWRITKMILIIFITFVLSYLPITIIKLVDPNALYEGVHLIGYLFIYLSCCINPVIYVVMNKQYREAFLQTLLCNTSLSYQTEADPANRSKSRPLSELATDKSSTAPQIEMNTY